MPSQHGTKGIGGQGISSPRPGSDGIDNSARVGWRVGPALGGVCLIALGSRKVRLLNLTADKVPSPHPARPCSGAEFRVVFAGFAAPFGQPGHGSSARLQGWRGWPQAGLSTVWRPASLRGPSPPASGRMESMGRPRKPPSDCRGGRPRCWRSRGRPL